jgi:hypothetical protein
LNANRSRTEPDRHRVQPVNNARELSFPKTRAMEKNEKISKAVLLRRYSAPSDGT